MVAKARITSSRLLRREEVHVGPRDHDFAHLHLAEFDGADDKFFFAGRQQAPLTGLLNLNLQFFGGVRGAVHCRLGTPSALHDRRRKRHRAGRWPSEMSCRNQENGRAIEQSDAFGARQADGLGHEFANHDVKGANMPNARPSATAWAIRALRELELRPA